MLKFFVYTAFFSLLLIACSVMNDIDNDTYSVKGVVLINNFPAENATIMIDSSTSFREYSDHEGNFKINNVPTGKHKISIYKSDDEGSYSNIEKDINVNSDTDLATLQLPKPVSIELIEYNAIDGILLKWDKSGASDFREYKLFRTDHPGIDDLSGQLLFTSISRNDTIFSDQSFLSQKDYYYRIYIMNEYGKLGGSNIIKVSTFDGSPSFATIRVVVSFKQDSISGVYVNFTPNANAQGVEVITNERGIAEYQKELISTETIFMNLSDFSFPDGSGLLNSVTKVIEINPYGEYNVEFKNDNFIFEISYIMPYNGSSGFGGYEFQYNFEQANESDFYLRPGDGEAIGLPYGWQTSQHSYGSFQNGRIWSPGLDIEYPANTEFRYKPVIIFPIYGDNLQLESVLNDSIPWAGYNLNYLITQWVRINIIT